MPDKSRESRLIVIDAATSEERSRHQDKSQRERVFVLALAQQIRVVGFLLQGEHIVSLWHAQSANLDFRVRVKTLS